MKDLVFVGGAKGVGKTTLISALVQYVPLNVFNTGSIFYDTLQRSRNLEHEVCNYLLNNHSGIVDTHYAGYDSQSGFSRGLSTENLRKITKHKSADFLLLEINAEYLLKRRIDDIKKQRIQDLAHIKKELEANRKYFTEYCEETSIKGLIIENINIYTSLNELRGRVI